MSALAIDRNTLIIGIGNSGRQDDGLGWAFLDNLKARSVAAEIVYRYQLNIEDAELISRWPKVLFVDADKREIRGGFELSHVEVTAIGSVSSHTLSPGNVLGLCYELYGKKPKARVLRIQGYAWELEQGITPDAQMNLAKALSALSVVHLN